MTLNEKNICDRAWNSLPEDVQTRVLDMYEMNTCDDDYVRTENFAVNQALEELFGKHNLTGWEDE